VNPAAVELAGRPEEELIGSSVTETYVPEESTCFGPDRQVESGRIFSFERKFLKKNAK